MKEKDANYPNLILPPQELAAFFDKMADTVVFPAGREYYRQFNQLTLDFLNSQRALLSKDNLLTALMVMVVEFSTDNFLYQNYWLGKLPEIIRGIVVDPQVAEEIIGQLETLISSYLQAADKQAPSAE